MKAARLAVSGRTCPFLIFWRARPVTAKAGGVDAAVEHSFPSQDPAVSF
jgi:hypothetical protein